MKYVEMKRIVNVLILFMVFTNMCTLSASPRKASALTWSYPTSTPAQPFDGGSGSSSDPYLISTPQQLANLAYFVNHGVSYKGKYFKMTDDIVLNSGVLAADGNLNSGSSFKAWQPIGGCLKGDNSTANLPFMGVFDGDGHSVSGIYYSNTSVCQIGLFGCVDGATIQNLGVVDSYIKANSRVGAICGLARNGAAISKCYSTASISASYWCAGGIAGCAYGEATKITLCYNSGKVYANNGTVAGICGGTSNSDLPTITYCYNTGNITGATDAAGIVSEGAGCSYCYNIGMVNKGYAVCKSDEIGVGNYYLKGVATYGGAAVGKDESAFYNGIVLGLLNSIHSYYQKGSEGYPTFLGVGEGSKGAVAYTLVLNSGTTQTVNIPLVTCEKFSSWTSTNKANSSKSSNTISFTASAGDCLSFDWLTSSEYEADMLNVKLDGSLVVTNQSGDGTNGSVCKILTAGSHTLYMEYSKDAQKSSFSDNVSVRNIKLTYSKTRSNISNVTLTDGSFKKISVENDFVADKLSYCRAFANTSWETLFVPFAMPYEAWKDKADVAKINGVYQYDDNGDGVSDRYVLEISKIENGSILPNTPYLIRGKKAASCTFVMNAIPVYKSSGTSFDCSSMERKYAFVGNYATVSSASIDAANVYLLNGGKLVKNSSASSISPLRWYMTAENREGYTGNMTSEILLRVAGEETGSGLNGDVNLDGMVNIADVSALVKMLLGK